MPTETHEFRAEARQLLQLMIHSIYSSKDVFLRELVSNASDALDKLRLEALRDDTLDADVSDLHIFLETDPDARSLTVRDNGIGMARDEVVRLIGTIAESGTAKFLKEWKENQDADTADSLIGQFGIGFYSAFMVADEVVLLTRRAGERGGTRWVSRGEGSYTIEDVDEAPQGTSVTLRLRPVDLDDRLHDYADPAVLRDLVRRYSDFVTWPIRMAPRPAEAAGDEAAGPPAEPAEAEVLNSMRALWTRPRSEVSDDEYHTFYKHLSHDWSDPLETVRFQAEGTFEYQALLFLPSHPLHDMYAQGYEHGVQLYVKHVFIMDNCAALLPTYLRFVKGVVDSQDLSLNVSREILQQDRRIQMMHRRLVKKVLSTVKELMTRDPERYATLWRHFGAVLKEGLLSDADNRASILSLSSFDSTHDAERKTTLAEYVERMKPDQEHIYYLTGPSRQTVENSPHLEMFREKGIEVLLLTDPVDEAWVGIADEFDGRRLHSAAKGEVDLGGDDGDGAAAEERRQQREEFAGLLSWMTGRLSESVKEVRLSSRLTNSPACLVSDTADLTPALENMYRAMGQGVPRSKRILELNPDHTLVTAVHKAFTERGDGTGPDEVADLLHGLAALSEGGTPTDPAGFANLVADRLTGTL